MQGLRDWSFLPTKKNLAPAGDDEGRIMYSFMASLSGPETEYKRPLGMVEPGHRCSRFADVEERTWLWFCQKLLGGGGSRGALSSGLGIQSLWRN